MITIQQYGGRFIFSTPRTVYRRRHDLWPTHAVEAVSNGVTYGASLIAFPSWVFVLKSGWEGYYLAPGYQNPDEAYAFARSFVTSDGNVGAYGEWYNQIARPLCFAKVYIGDIDAWVDAH
jgi:hypothetical protein